MRKLPIPKFKFFLKKKSGEICTVLLSFTIFVLRFGFTPLNIFNAQWIKELGGDFTTELVSWVYFLHTPNTFPPTISGYDYPTVTGVGMTGSMPVLALPLKAVYLLFSSTFFQHFGWWFAICYVLQGVFAYKILSPIFKACAPENKLESITLTIIGSLFFVIAPPFLFRYAHVNLNGHFLILAGLFFYDRPQTTRKSLFVLLILCGISAGIHQYFVLMLLGIAFAAALKQLLVKQIKLWQFVVYIFGLLGFVFLVFYLSGDFILPVSIQQNDGFGKYAANLNTFWNPMENSKFMHAFPLAFSEQYEGFAYLGFGVIILVLSTFLLKIYFPHQKNKFRFSIDPLTIVALLLFVLALSKNICFNDKILVQIPIFDKTVLGIFLNSFRSSGRFVWVLYYLLMIEIFRQFAGLTINNYFKISFLIILFSLQCFELTHLFHLPFNPDANKSALPKSVQDKVFLGAEKVVMYPPYSWNYGVDGDFYSFASVTSSLGIPITTGYYARPDWSKKIVWENNFNAALDTGALFDAKNAIIISKMSEVGRFDSACKRGLLTSFACNGYALLVPPSLPNTITFLQHDTTVEPLHFFSETLSQFMQRNANKTVLLSVFDEATRKLSDAEKTYLKSVGSAIGSTLAYRGSYVGVFFKGRLVYEQFKTDTPAEKTFRAGEKVNNFIAPKFISLLSKGAAAGFGSSITVDGVEFSPREQGFNCVVLDANGKVIEATHINTYLSSSHVVFLKK